MELLARAHQFFSPERKDFMNNNAATKRTLTFRQRYGLGKVLGKGTYSIVRKGYDVQTKEKVAVKCIEERDLSENDAKSLKREVQMLSQLRHPNIIGFRSFYHDHVDRMYFIVTEHCNGGELFDAIVQKVCYSEDTARKIISTLANAIKYCHDRNIVHRDLKPENILLKRRSNVGDFEMSDLKIADFGFAKYLKKDTGLTTICGSPIYVAPEIISKKEYGKGVDIWSLGIISYILLCGYPPFNDSDTEALFRKIKTGRFEFHVEHWKKISHNAKDLIVKMLNVNAKRRYNIHDVLSHPWLNIVCNVTKRVNFDAVHFDNFDKASFNKFDTHSGNLRNYSSTDTSAASVGSHQQDFEQKEADSELHSVISEADTEISGTPLKVNEIAIDLKDHVIAISPKTKVPVNFNVKSASSNKDDLKGQRNTTRNKWKFSLTAVKVATRLRMLSLSSNSLNSKSSSVFCK